MKKSVLKFIICFIFIMLPLSVKASITYTFPTGNYHVVYIKDNGTTTACDNISIMNYDSTNIEYLSSYNTYDEALTYMNSLTSTTTKVAAIIGQKKDKTGTYVNSILNAQYALVDINTAGTSGIYTLLYTSATNNSAYTYINGNGAYGGVDAALLNYNNGTTKANIKMSAVSGWINSLLYLDGSTYNGYEIVPLSIVKSPNFYYVNDSGELVHRLSKKITANNCYSRTLVIGPAPSYLTAKDTNGNMIYYYSFDGIYFYTSMFTMLDDYKNNTNVNAVNVVPYYNYYMYLPIRSQTNLANGNLKAFMESRNYTTPESSKLYNQDATFLDAQEKYGVNAVISFATAIQESTWGTSSYAINNNNLFGHNVYDTDTGAGSTYSSVENCIYEHAYYMIDTLFSETKDVGDRYHGSHVGNKNSGINVKYASDPFWGEKIASFMYSIDDFNDMKDYNKYSVGIKISSANVAVKKEANNASTTLYTLKSDDYSVSNMSVIILDRVVGESIEGNNIWYKIQSDALLDDNRENVIQDVASSDRYDWTNDYGYVHSSYITLMGQVGNNIYVHKDGIFGLENLSLNTSNNTINIKGYLGITDMNNDKSKTITYDIVFQNQTDNKTYELPLDRITDLANIPFTVTYDKYDYTYSWFNGTLDLSSIPEGDYTLYIRARSGGYESKEILSNILSRNSITKFTDSSGRGYRFRTNYYLKTIPLELSIRDDGLISNGSTPTSDNMINQYHEIELKDGKLNISGSSFNIGGDYSTSQTITRSIIFENKSTFSRYEYNLGYIDNGVYPITLIVSDSLDKTRAWFNNSVDISSLDKGVYTIYIKTKSTFEDYDELNDIFSRNITTTMTYNSKIYSLSVNESQRFRIELTIK